MQAFFRRTSLLAGAALIFAAGVASADNTYRDPIPPYQSTKPMAEQPLMVIRFHKSPVYYQTQLFNVVQKTIQVKPNATFDTVFMVSKTGQPELDKRSFEQAKASWSQVLQTLTDIGVPEQQISVNFQQTPEVENNELRIFVH